MPLDLFGSLAPAPAAAAAVPAQLSIPETQQPPAPTSNVMDLFGSLSAPANNTTARSSESVATPSGYQPAPVTATPINGPAASMETVATPAASVESLHVPGMLEALDADLIKLDQLQANAAETVHTVSGVIEGKTLSDFSERLQPLVTYGPVPDAELGRAVRTLLAVWRNG